MIQVDNIKRSFRSVKKEEGWRGTLNLLLKPQYTSHEALKGVSFSIEPGAFVGLIGANGAGKTTLLKILSGLIPPTEGSATVLGQNPFERSLHFRHSISLVMGQKAQLWWDLPAQDAFELLRAIYNIPIPTYRQRLEELSTLLDVKPLLQTQIRRLSLGERMKMELIGALLHWPKVIFLDEPTIGLDVLAAHKLREFLREFNQRQKATIILTSHNMDDIERLCTRVLILRQGSLIFDGAPSQLTRSGLCQLRVQTLRPVPKTELSLWTGISPNAIHYSSTEADEESSEEKPTGTVLFTLEREKIVSTLQTLMSRTTLIEMGIEEQSLESVIQNLYANETQLANRSS